MPNSTDMPNACCRKANDEGALLTLDEDQEGAPPGGVVYRCPECRCRHFELEVDPAVIGVEVSSL